MRTSGLRVLSIWGAPEDQKVEKALGPWKTHVPKNEVSLSVKLGTVFFFQGHRAFSFLPTSLRHGSLELGDWGPDPRDGAFQRALSGQHPGPDPTPQAKLPQAKLTPKGMRSAPWRESARGESELWRRRRNSCPSEMGTGGNLFSGLRMGEGGVSVPIVSKGRGDM